MNAVQRRRGPGRPADPTLAGRRRDEILAVAARLFAERGFAQTDVQVVADALSLGKGTIYRYFPTKRALFLAAADRAMQRLSEAIDAELETAPTPLDALSTAVRSYLAFFDTHPEYVELIILERAEFHDRKRPTYFEYQDAHIGRWHDLLRGLIRARVLRDIPVERIADVASNLLYGTIFTNLFAGRKKTLEDQARDVLDILFQGILRRPTRGAPKRSAARRRS